MHTGEGALPDLMPWLLRGQIDGASLEARILAVGGRLQGRRSDGAWRLLLPSDVWRRIDLPSSLTLEPEPVVQRIHRPLRRSSPPGFVVPGSREQQIRVIDPETGRPVEGVTALLAGRSGMIYRARTDAEGIARMEVSEDAFVRLELLPMDAYWPRMVTAGLSSDRGATLELTLEALPSDVPAYGWGMSRAMKLDQVHALGFRGKDIRIAVLDTGVSAHPSLEIRGGVNTADTEPEDRWQDTHWHGTHVAGILAAHGRSSALLGVAPDAELYAVRVGRVTSIDAFRFSNALFETDLLEGLEWCLEHGIEVINMSLFSQPSRALEDVIERAYRRGVILVAPSGNRRDEADGQDLNSVDYPASNPRVIAVGAVGRLDTYPRGSYFEIAEQSARFSPRFRDYYIPGFSRHGQGLDFVAPGVAILSTVPGALKGWDVDNRRLTGYTTWMGTSQAAPFIAGLCALILESHPEIRALADQRKVEAVRDVLARASISLHIDPLYQGKGLPYAPACVRSEAELG